MKLFMGIDLGSTTTKAVALDENRRILGRGITNSRSNYDLAAQVAREETYASARFQLLHRHLEGELEAAVLQQTLTDLSSAYRLEMHLLKLKLLHDGCLTEAESGVYRDASFEVPQVVSQIFASLKNNALIRRKGTLSESDFFRDLANAAFTQEADSISLKHRDAFEILIGIFDKSILKVENTVVESGFAQIINDAAGRLRKNGVYLPALDEAIAQVAGIELEATEIVGTGYGRQRLPFPPEAIRSEILCHGLGANFLMPKTATVLDIGGQDTKAIQIDKNGLVTSFQMNDRCAAGCGRYLGYIADEMNLGLHELGPLALKADRTPKINSTCTVFAGAELRNRLMAGEKRENILAGLHRAIIVRAMSLLARSGGIRNEFTLTGGVAKNSAAVAALRKLVDENYGDQIRLNISPDSIYIGALGAALFALDNHGQKEATA